MSVSEDRLEAIRVCAISKKITKHKIGILSRGLNNPEGEVRGMVYQTLEWFVMHKLVEYHPKDNLNRDSRRVLTERARAVLRLLKEKNGEQVVFS